MGSLGTVVVVLVAVALLVAAFLQLRSGPLPFPAIITAALTCAVCYTVAGTVSSSGSGPSVPTVVGSLVGVLALVAMVVSLVPRRPQAEGRARPRSPIVIAVAGTVIGAVGLLVHQLL